MSTLALAAAVTLGLASPDALALALGRVTVQSALGEPLRAEIDVPEITPEEVSSLRATVASPQAFRSAGLEYSPALANVQITLQRRPNGSYFLHLASDRAVNDPFVDVILQATWASGRVQRDFTMLFDPPTRQAAAPAPLAAQVSPGAGRPATTAPAPSAAARPAPAPAPAAAPAARAPATASKPAASGDGKKVPVQAGDTAGKLAAANKPAGVSLDQMLLAMLRANPDAFIGGNVNRLRAGAVLEMPSGDQASSVPTGEARQTLVAQSRDFNEFRRRVAEGVPPTATPSTTRQTTGRVQAQVEDQKSATATPDKLTLSKGALQGRNAAAADQIAKDRAAKDQATRLAELNKNIADLNKLTGTPSGSGGAGTRPGTGTGISSPPGLPASAARPASTPVAATSTAPVAKPASAPAPVVAAAKPASAAAPVAAAKPASAPAALAVAPAAAPTLPASAAPAAAVVAAAKPASAAAPAASTPLSATSAASPSTPATTAATATGPADGASAALAAASAASGPLAATSAPATTTAAAKPLPRKPAPPPPPEPSLLDDMLENPVIPVLGLGLLAFLLGFGFYKIRKRKAASVDSSFLESRLQPDSFFGASGGQRIDTAETNNPTGSSMVYSPSQLDAAGDVDPVAEADVYLAYGRDLQAEEILKEALRINPQRVAIHSKLLEIYAKRRDVKAFEVVAAEAYNLTGGHGTEWEHICDLGRELDAANPMYRPGGHPVAGAAVAAATATAASFASTKAMQAPAPAAAPAASDLDLDLDFSLGDEPETVQQPLPAPVMPPAGRPQATAPHVATMPAPLAMDFSKAPSLDLPPSQPEPVRLESPGLALNENSLNFDAPAPIAAPVARPAPVAAPAPVADNGMLEFDLGGLSLDLPGASASPAAPAAAPAALPSMDLDVAPMDFDAGDTAGGKLEADSPLATKLALAEEFNAIGDADGARSLAEEVLAEASGDLKSRAQRLLAEIG